MEIKKLELSGFLAPIEIVVFKLPKSKEPPYSHQVKNVRAWVSIGLYSKNFRKNIPVREKQ